MSMTVATEPKVDDLIQFHAGRRPSGLRRKYRRMAEGPFEFFRGTNFLFARAWPELRPREPGPAVWLCGDLHLENFGAFPTDEAEFRFDVNDFDDAIVGPCSLDLVRCATSTLLAAESWQLTPTQGIGMVLEFLDAYRQGVIDDAAGHADDMAEPDLAGVRELLTSTAHGSLEEQLFKYAKPKRKGWRLRQKRRLRRAGEKTTAAVTEAIEALDCGWKVLDVARRDSGIGSLGMRRFVVLTEERDRPEPILLSVKEIGPSSVAAFADPVMPTFEHDAERAVTAQRLLQLKPTTRLLWLTIADRPFRVRAMIPDENRSSLKHLQERPGKLRAAVAALGRLTARSQRRGSKLDGRHQSAKLKAWAESPALDSVLAAAVRFADWTKRDYRIFVRAYREGAFEVEQEQE